VCAIDVHEGDQSRDRCRAVEMARRFVIHHKPVGPALLVTFLIFAGCGAQAQIQTGNSPRTMSQNTPSSSTTTPSITEADLERARQLHRMPTDAELARVPIPMSPRLDELPKVANTVASTPALTPAPTGDRKVLDLNALSKGFDQGLASQNALFGLPQTTGPSLLVFISLSMPVATLNRLLDQAQSAGATLVLRGLVHGSIRDTALQVRQLIGTRQVSVQIDPEAFDRYAITQVPAFVLLAGLPNDPNSNAGPACSSPVCENTSGSVRVARVFGDVSVEHALTHIERAAPVLATQARLVLKRLAVHGSASRPESGSTRFGNTSLGSTPPGSSQR
jgi:conjugal transfer pilus assembly protein TrbC